MPAFPLTKIYLIKVIEKETAVEFGFNCCLAWRRGREDVRICVVVFFELKQIIFKCVYVKNKVTFNLIAIKFNKCYNTCAT